MRLAFVHDNFFYKHKGEVYSEGHFFALMWDRYLKHCSELLIIARQGNITESTKELKGFNISSRTGVKFILLSDTDSFSARFLSQDIKKSLYENLQKVDGVICRVPSFLGNLSANICEERGIPYALEVVGSAWDSYWNYGTLKARIYAPISHLQTRRIIGKSRFCLYVTNDFLQKVYPANNALLILNASNIELVSYDIPERKHCNNKIVTLGVIGQVHHKYKGIHFLIRALSELNKNGHLFDLRILGPGDTSFLASYAETNNVEKYVYFDGLRRSGKDVYSWLDDIDIYVQPSLQEGLPRTLIEAMSRGLPCIGTTAGGMYELLEKEYICKTKNWKCLSKKIKDMSLNIEKTHSDGLQNLETSKKFEKTKIDLVRENFYGTFVQSINKKI